MGGTKGFDITLDIACAISSGWWGSEHTANMELPAQIAQLFDQADNHQRMAAEFKEMVMAAACFNPNSFCQICARAISVSPMWRFISHCG
ncbi:hypothetical protein [Xenorhabdus thailandensis]|uniref:hypothetical protein n=1 Tax=Xenorhabdus thailandensis TaxID=3136255 RepID=UPI003BF5CC99